MWLLFHRNAKTKVVKDGETFVQTCPECREHARFIEVQVEENYGVWFIDVIGDKSRAYKCCGCGEVFDAKADAPAASKPMPAVKTEREREIEQIKAELARRQAERTRAAATAAKETRIDDELAELKKRMGR